MHSAQNLGHYYRALRQAGLPRETARRLVEDAGRQIHRGELSERFFIGGYESAEAAA